MHRVFLMSNVAFAALVPAAAGAQNLVVEPESEPVIIVTGEGLPQTPATPAYSAVELDRETVVSTASGRLEDALSQLAGFQQFRRSDSRSANPSAQGVTLRALGGNATSRALVLLDGVPLADPFFGYIPLSAIAPETLGSVRITRGGGAGPFGSGALAGTIELTSAGREGLAPLSASALINDRGETEASASVATRLGQGFAVASGRWDRGQGFFTTPAAQRVPANVRAAFDSWSLGLRAVAPLSDTAELQAAGRAYRDERTLRFAGADSLSEGADASLRVLVRGDWQFEALAYLQARNFANVVISSTRFVPVLDQRNTPSTGIGGKLELRPPLGRDHVMRLGLDYRQASGELQEEALNAFTGLVTERRRAGGKTSDLGAYVEHDWTLGQIVLTGGIRADRTAITNGFYRAVDRNAALVSELIAPDRAEWSYSFRGGVLWQASDALRLRAAGYRGFRLPTLNELYRPFVVFPVVTQANSALENERLEGIEAGFDVTPAAGVSLSMTVFDNRVENAIANVSLTPTLRKRQNLPAIKARGAEASLAAYRGAFRFDGSLAYTDARVEGRGVSAPLDGLRPAQTPRWMASATVGWQPKDTLRIAATIRHIGQQFESDLESDALPAVTTLGLFAQIPLFDTVALVLRGENLTDETVITRNSGGDVDLGTPRTLWGGIRIGF